MAQGRKKELTWDKSNKAWTSWVYLPTGKRVKLYLCKGRSRTNDKAARNKAEQILKEKKLALNIIDTTPEPPKPSPVRQSKALRDVTTIAGIIDLYLKSIELRFFKEDISQARLNQYYWSMDLFEEFLGPKVNADKDHKLGGAVKLMSATRYQGMTTWLERQVATKRLKASSAKVVFWVVKDFFDYAFDQGRSEYEPSSRIRLMLGKHKKAVEVATFSRTQVLTLLEYNMQYLDDGRRHQRNPLELFILMGLNLGFTGIEFSTLKRSDIEFQDGIPVRITKSRSKTGVVSSWKLWPLTSKLLKQYIEFHNRTKPDDLVFVTREGNPMVYYRAYSRTDQVSSAFHNRIHDHHPEMKGLSFKHFRKTGATFIANWGDKNPALAQAYLAHSYGGTLKFYAKPTSTMLDDALDAMEHFYGLDKLELNIPIRR